MADLNHAKRVFAAALQVDAEVRDAFVVTECKSDPELLATVRRLLAAHDAADDFLDVSTQAGAKETEPEAIGEQPGDIIDRYKLLQEIGRGGMGVVWMAEQQEPVRRKVALKVIKLGMDTAEVVARFEAERQALALMDHPNIAKVLDGGATESGRPYFVMELVKGVPITEFCDKARTVMEQRLRIFQQICHAVHHAHQKGVIHRDLKPANVLVTLHDGIPTPKVIDFGIAKATSAELTSRTLFTQFKQMVGTPEYMAPEQAELSGLDIDTRADIYSLGVLLYELLTGTRPFEVAALLERGYAEMLRVIREEDPPKPSTRLSTLGDMLAVVAKQRLTTPGQLAKRLTGEIDWIVMRSLEKDRSRRYGSANELADDVGRHLRNEPVLAGPPTARYRLRKYVARHRVGVLAGGFIAASLVIGLGMAIWGLVEAHDQREVAQRIAAREQETVRVLRQMILSITPEQAQGKDTELLRELLDETARRLDDGEVTDETVALNLYQLLGKAYHAISAFERAVDCQRNVAALTRKLHPDTPEQSFLADTALASSLHRLGALDEAEQLLRDMPTENTHGRVQGLTTLASVYQSQGRMVEALETARAAVVTVEAMGATATTNASERAYDLLAQCLHGTGERKGAIAIYRKRLAALPKDIDEADSRRLTLRFNLALALSTSGEPVEARMILEQLLPIYDKLYDDQHDDFLRLRSVYGRLLCGIGEAAAGFEQLRLSYEGEAKSRGKTSLAAAESLARLADGALWTGSSREVFGRAFGQVIELIDTTLRELGEPRTNEAKAAAMTLHYTRGFLDHETGNLQQALESLQASVALLDANPVIETENSRATLRELAIVYSKLRRHEDSLPLCERWVAAAKKHDGAGSPEYFDARMTYGLTLMQVGRLDEAEVELVAAHAGEVAIGGPDSAVTVAGRGNLATLRDNQGRFDEAIELYTKNIEVLRMWLARDIPEASKPDLRRQLLTSRLSLVITLDRADRLGEIRQHTDGLLPEVRRVFAYDPSSALWLEHAIVRSLAHEGSVADARAMLAELEPRWRERFKNAPASLAKIDELRTQVGR